MNATELRNQVWDDYYYRQQNRICSRCGDYNKYDIEQIIQPIERDLNEKYDCDFYLTTFKIKTTRILTRDSLSETDWGCLCQRCKDHTLGKQAYFLSSSLEDAEFELQDMKQNERKRQLKQEDEIKKLRKQFNKERRENGGNNNGSNNSNAKPIRELVHNQLNPNDIEKNNSSIHPDNMNTAITTSQNR